MSKITNQGELKRIKLADIVPSKTNPRKEFKTPDWAEFVDSVRSHGVIQPGLARPHPKDCDKVELVAGERRYRASGEAKLPDMPLVIRDLTDAEVIELQQVENLQREDLSALEEAQGYADWRDSLVKSGAVKTVDEAVAHICGRINRKRSTVYGRLALLKTSPKVQDCLRQGQLDASKAQLIAQVPDQGQQQKILKEALEGDRYGNGPMSVRELQEHIEENYRISLKGAPFKQETIFVGQPTCVACPYRTGNMQLEDPKASPDVCTNPGCYRSKCEKTAKESAGAIAGVLTDEQWRKGGWSKWCEAGDTCYEDGANRNWAAVFGKEKPPVYLVIREGNRGLELKYVWDKAKAIAFAKEHKLFKGREKQALSAEEKRWKAEDERRRKKEELQEKQQELGLLAAISRAANEYKLKKDGTQNGELPLKFWKNLAKGMVLSIGGYQIEDSMGKGRGPELEAAFAKRNCAAKEKGLFTYIDAQELPLNLISLLVQLQGQGMNDYDGDLTKFLGMWGVDWKKMKLPAEKAQPKAVVKTVKKGAGK